MFEILCFELKENTSTFTKEEKFNTSPQSILKVLLPLPLK